MSKKAKIISFSIFFMIAFLTTIFLLSNAIEYDPLLNAKLTKKNATIEEASETLVEEYITQYEHWYLPFDKQINRVNIDNVEVLDEQKGYVQVDYSFYFTFAKSIPSYFANDNFHLFQNEDNKITGQLVLQLKRKVDTYQVKVLMTPVQYQLASDSSLRTQQSKPYDTVDKEASYFIDEQTLYVTYDFNKTAKKVDVPYDDIAYANALRYDVYLKDGSYLISKDFTGFLAYNSNDGLYLVYSLDAAKTWQKSSIHPRFVEGSNITLTKTEQYYYVSFAGDRSLGHDYYAISKTSDLKNWQFEDTSLLPFDQYGSLLYTNDTTAYISPIRSTSQTSLATLYYSNDNFASIQEIVLPEVVETTKQLGYHPFVNVEYIYQENGIIYVEVGQGESGDYGKDGYLVKALYQSEDGFQFHFVKEFDNSKQLAG